MWFPCIIMTVPPIPDAYMRSSATSPTWAIPKDHKVTKALEEAYKGLYGETRLGNAETEAHEKGTPAYGQVDFLHQRSFHHGPQQYPLHRFRTGSRGTGSRPPTKKNMEDRSGKDAQPYTRRFPEHYCQIKPFTDPERTALLRLKKTIILPCKRRLK